MLCVFGFRGMGYDEAHAEAMAVVIERLRAPEAMVCLVAGLDAVCAVCPHREADRCASPEHRRDRAVLAALELAPGHVERAETLFARVARGIFPEDLAVLCAGCSWHAWGVCAEGLAQGCIAAGWEQAAISDKG